MLKPGDMINGYTVLRATEFDRDEGPDFGVIFAYNEVSRTYVTARTTPWSLADGQWAGGYYRRSSDKALAEYDGIVLQEYEYIFQS